MSNRILIEQLTEAELEKRFRRNRITSEAIKKGLRLVFLESSSIMAASRQSGVNYASLHRAVRSAQNLCPHCGQPKTEKD